MKKLTNNIPHHSIAKIAIITIIVGLFVGKALLSIGSLLLFLNGFFNANVFKNLKKVWQLPIYQVCICLFFTYVIGGIWSVHPKNYWAEIQLHLPFIGYAIGFSALGFVSKKEFKLYGHILMACTFLGILYSLYFFIANYNMVLSNYGISQMLKVPFKGDHIRFSLVLLINILYCYYYFKPTVKSTWVYGFFALFIFIFIHILASKIALLGLYILLLSFGVHNAFAKRKIKNLLLILFACMVLPIIAYYVSPTFKAKFNYTKYSYENAGNDAAATFYSDKGRLISYSLAWPIIKLHPMLGVGTGSAKPIMDNAYLAKFGKQNFKALIPHNQFIMLLLSLGLLGLTICVWFWYCSFRASKNFILLMFNIIFLLAFNIEPMWEIQYGICIHIFFLLLLNKFFDTQKL